MEDYPGRYIPRGFRSTKTLFQVCSSSLGGLMAYLADLAIGASIGSNYGVMNGIKGIMMASVVIFFMSLPLAYLSCRYNVDFDLIGRGTFGFMGSIVTAVIFSCMCVIWFTLEGSMMAQALFVALTIPLSAGYVICTIVIVPLVYYGVKLLAILQIWTTPMWIVLMFTPIIYLAVAYPETQRQFHDYVPNIAKNNSDTSNIFNSAGIVFSLIMGVAPCCDYIRIFPPITKENRFGWYFGMILAGCGWIFISAIKQIIGMYFGIYLILTYKEIDTADQPIHQLVRVYSLFLPYVASVLIAALLVFVSQLKINVTNAYCGSLAMSNVFTRITKKSTKRWYFMSLLLIASTILMELNAFAYLNSILSFTSNFSIAWIVTVFSDVVICKYLFKYTANMIPQYKKGVVYDYNPVGLVTLSCAILFSIITASGGFGINAVPFNQVVSFIISLAMPPIIAKITRGKYYLRRFDSGLGDEYDIVNDAFDELGNPKDICIKCHVCGEEYEIFDMLMCEKHTGHICSICLIKHDECLLPSQSFMSPSRSGIRQRIPFRVELQERRNANADTTIINNNDSAKSNINHNNKNHDNHAIEMEMDQI